MIVGDCSVFAIESRIADVVESPSQLALGSFLIHIGGRAFGVRKPDASMLGCSFHEVERRLRRQGKHLLPELADITATDLAAAYLDALYRETSRTDYLGFSLHPFIDALQSSGVIWAPDGDAAFDDGSHILQFDVGRQVRIVGFMDAEAPDDLSGTISEAWMDADLFYAVVSGWKTLFAIERSISLKG